MPLSLSRAFQMRKLDLRPEFDRHCGRLAAFYHLICPDKQSERDRVVAAKLRRKFEMFFCKIYTRLQDKSYGSTHVHIEYNSQFILRSSISYEK